MPTRKATIVWTPEDQTAIVNEAARLMHGGEVRTKTPALRLAMQTALPPAKRRNIDGLMSHVGKWYTPRLAAKLAELAAEPAAQQAWNTHRKDGGKKVFWKPAEQAILARACAEAILSGAANTRAQALRVAQAALPPERRRNVNALTTLPWFEAGVDAALEEVSHRNVVKAVEIAAAAVSPESAPVPLSNGHDRAQTPPQGASAPAPLLPYVEPLAAPHSAIPGPVLVHLAALRPLLVDAAADFLADVALAAFAKFVTRLPTHPPEPPGREFEAPGQHNPRPTAGAARQVRPAVLVAGLKGAQKAIIEAEFGNALNLRFYGSDESKDQLRTMAGAADVAVAVTDFLSHSHTDIMKARSANYVPTGGGMNTLRSTLIRLVAEAHARTEAA